jgi:hypothetical protein
VTVRPAWEFAAAAAPRGLALAREKAYLLAWDEQNWLYLLHLTGRRQAQVPAPQAIAAGAASDDGSAFAAIGTKGEVWWLAPDLMPRWQRLLPHPAVAAALDPFGQYLAVADRAGGLVLFNRHGKALAHVRVPRPLLHLAFVPESPTLVGSSDLGLVAAFDLAGNCRWRDGLAAHVGGLAVSGRGERVLLACFSEGLRQYALDGKPRERIAVAEPCRLVGVDYLGQRLLVGGLDRRVLLLDGNGQALADHSADGALTALALTPLGNFAVAALADGRLLGLELRSPAG